jgi:hypothetical protein
MKPLRIGKDYSPDLEGWRPLKENEIELVEKTKPIDFSKFLKPTPVETQAEKFDLKNLYTSIQKTPRHSAWPEDE